ncbi:hypothetical protein VFPPC_10912 [Pochonia chlamydosporia 170]|uniref:2EXR domain-containing protein n=1 Tax=Pochonia chlamydosporia 170 TaxID=1380566 RepID=A0A179EZU0_METCM|nr:hypothetical protein VFPPC_10912 [Pochonia chlamydosporia 170]OAQ58678.1 hypothetical protein VFPPC_10912 [Pochonia chlamydosporia 170]
MFPLFLQLPSEIRRKIWLATLGPMTLTFTQKEPELEVDQESDVNAELWGDWEPGPHEHEWNADEDVDTDETPEPPSSEYTDPKKLFANYTRYFGHVALADGSSRLQFVVEPSAAYLACKESRAFLRFIFAEQVRPNGGLPSWFRFDMDTIRCTNFVFYIIRNHSWFKQTQHLIIAVVFESFFYFEFGDWDEEPNGDEWDADWIGNNLPLLTNITFEMLRAKMHGTRNTYRWLDGWFDVFEEWYNCKYGSEPVSFHARVISHEISEEEWLTPTNYLRVYKLVSQKRNKVFFPDDDWKPHMRRKMLDILEATDEQLENLTEFLEKHRPLWDD